MDRTIGASIGTVLTLGVLSTFLGFYILGLGVIAIGGYVIKNNVNSRREERVYLRQLASEEFDIVSEQVDKRVPGTAFMNHWYGVQGQEGTTPEFVDTLFGVERQ